MSGIGELESLVGNEFAGKYRILSLCGSGGMSAVFKAEHIFMARIVAIKLLLRDTSSSEEARKRFEREAKIISRVQHPSTVAIYDYGVMDGTPYLVMEFVAGRTLSEIVRDEGRLPEAVARRIVTEVCKPLEFAHGVDIVHRDIKASNIMLEEGDFETAAVKLLDFGIAKSVAPAVDNMSQMTVAGTLLGTPQYMSPEQCLSKPVDARTDVYSMGIVLFELLTGRVPFVAKSLIELVIAHTNQIPSFPPTDSPISAELESICMKCLAKDPADRYCSAAELRAALEEIGKPITERVMPAVEPEFEEPTVKVQLRSAGRGWPFARLLGGLVLIVGVAAAIGQSEFWRSGEQGSASLQTADEAIAINEPSNVSVASEAVSSVAVTPLPVPAAPVTTQAPVIIQVPAPTQAQVPIAATSATPLPAEVVAPTAAATSLVVKNPVLVATPDPVARSVTPRPELRGDRPAATPPPSRSAPPLPELSASLRLRQADNLSFEGNLSARELRQFSVVLLINGVVATQLERGLPFMRLEFVDSRGKRSGLDLRVLSLGAGRNGHRLQAALGGAGTAALGSAELVLSYNGRVLASQATEVRP